LRDSTWVRTSSILSSSHRGDANRHGIAILLKSLLHLSYFPDGFQEVPESVRTFLAKQLGLLVGSQ